MLGIQTSMKVPMSLIRGNGFEGVWAVKTGVVGLEF